MATGVKFPGCNLLMKAPEGSDDVVDLDVFANGAAVVSCWQLTPEELEEINRTGQVFVSVLCGAHFFPMYAGSEAEVRRMVADTGPVWPSADRKCFNPDCPTAGTHYPVIRFGPAERVQGQPLPYNLEVPQLTCLRCQPNFRPKTFITPEARTAMTAAIVDAGKPAPDYDRLIVEWKPADDDAYTELKGGGEARFWF